MRRAREAGREAAASVVAIAGALGLLACSAPPPEVGNPSEASTGSGSGEAITTSTGAAPSDGTTSDPGTTSGSGGGSSGPLDSTGTSADTTVALEGSGSSSDGSTGEEVSTVGCADGSRDALLDEAAHPNVAACAGGFWVAGVGSPVPQCGRQGGDDGPVPNGMGCSIEDLCAEGWHLCASRHEVAAAGLADCDAEAWSGQFFATGQSGEGDDACDDTGTNDVFGCGDVGHTNISGCAPLNRSTGNLCVNLPGAWDCEDAYDEVTHLVKPGPGDGGALCCRDGL